MSTSTSQPRTRYANETASLEDFGESRAAAFRAAPLVPLSDKRVRHIERLRLLTSPGCPVWDVSYVWGSGTGRKELFRVDLGVHQFPRQGLTGALIATFKEAGRYAKTMDVFEPGVQSKVW